MKKFIALVLAVLMLLAVLAGCAQQSAPAESTESEQTEQTAEPETPEQSAEEETPTEPEAEEEPEQPALPDGVYTAEFNTDSSMFHANEACDGKGTLTVENGEMTIHVSLASTSILNLFPGTAEDAQKDGAVLLQPTTDTVTYSDGLSDEVYGFDIPVPALDEEFDVALIGKKGKWYDHKVSVSNPEPKQTLVSDLADGEYTVYGTLEGGTGKTTLVNPTLLTVTDGKGIATVVLSSSKYDYMIVDGVKYEPVSNEGGSSFEIPVTALDVKIAVVADTVAMSTPHEIEYTILLDSSTLEEMK